MSSVVLDIDQAVRPQMQLGTTGLKRASGLIFEEFLPRLQGINGIRYYREMSDNSPVIGAAMQVIQMLVRQVEWRVEPADDTPEAKAQAEDTEFALFNDMSDTFEDLIGEVLSMLVYGWAYFEIVYKVRRGATDDSQTRSKTDDGLWGWRKVEIRAQDTLQRWQFDEEGGLNGMVQQDQYQGHGTVFLPIEKALLFRTSNAKGNPEGRSALRSGVLCYHDLKRIESIEATGVERDLAGMPIMEVPPELLAPNPGPTLAGMRSQLEKFVTQVKRDERWGGLVPSEVMPDGTSSQYKFKLMTTGGRRQIDTNSIIKRKESRLLMLFLAQFLIMGMDKVGSLALSSNMTDLFATALGTYMGQIASIINRFLIPRRQRLNGMPPELDPKLVAGDIEGPDLAQLGAFVKLLSDAGIPVTDPGAIFRLLSAADLAPPNVEAVEEAMNAKTEADAAAAEAEVAAAAAQDEEDAEDADVDEPSQGQPDEIADEEDPVS